MRPILHRSRASIAIVALTVGVLGATLVAARAATTGTPGKSYTVPTGIDRTGKTDVTDALTQFIRGVPDGSTIQFPSGGSYRINNIVLVSGRHDLVIDGGGSLFFAATDGRDETPPSMPPGVRSQWPRHRAQWIVYNGSNITIRNLSVRGNDARGGQADDAYNGALEAQNGIEYANVRHGLIKNCQVSQTWGDGVYIGSDSDSVVVDGCNIHHTGRQGVTIADAHNIVVVNSTIREIRRTAVDLEPYTMGHGVDNVWIARNHFEGVRGLVIGSKGGGDVSSIVVAYNTHKGIPFSVRNTPPANLTPRRHGWYIIGNVSDTMSGSPHGYVWIEHTDTVRVFDNYQPLQAGRDVPQLAVECNDCTDLAQGRNTNPWVKR